MSMNGPVNDNGPKPAPIVIRATEVVLKAAHGGPQTFEELVEAAHHDEPGLALTSIRGGIWSLLAKGDLRRTDEGLLVRS